MTMDVMTMGGAGILAVAFVVTSALRRAPASLRHLIWLAALSAILALPLLEWSGVTLEVPVPAAWMVPAASAAGEASSARGGASEMQGSDMQGSSASAGGVLGVAREASSESVSAVGSAGSAGSAGAAQTPVSVPVQGGRARPEAAAPTGRWTVDGDLLLSVAWAAGLLLMLAGTLLDHVRARRLTVRGVEPAPPATRRRFESLASELGVETPVRLMVSPRVRVPATWGILRSTVVLPEDYGRWSSGTLDRVLLHELAHVQRRDCSAYLVGELARAIHWPNPLVWLALYRLRAESERASDDRVVSFIDLPSDYARDLVSLVRAARHGSSLPRPALAMARPSGVSSRVRAILDPAQRRGRVARPAAAVVGLVALVLAVAATVLTPVAAAEVTPGVEATGVTTSEGITGRPRAGHTTDATRGGHATDGPRAEDTTDSVRPDGVPGRGLEPTPLEAGPQERLCVFREGGSRSTSVNMDDDEVRIRWETDDCRVEIDIEGDVRFAADDSGIAGMAPDALFEIEERIGRSARRARLEGRPGGAIERRYWEDGDEVAWGGEADRWLAGILPEIFRHSTINAEARVRRMLGEGGLDRVFAEVERIRSDHVRGRYLELTMQLGDLSEPDYARVIDAAGAIDSDHTSASLLLAVVETAGLRPAFQGPLLRASEGLDSDHERTRVLQTVLESPLSPEQLDAVLRSASSIDSDHNLGELLSVIARQGRLSDAGRASFLDALRSIESDHTHGRVVDAFLDEGPLSDAELAQVLDMTEGIDSDHERGEILRRVAGEYALTGAQVTAYLRSAAMLDSDHEASRVARAVIDRGELDTQQVGLVLRIADDVGSDHERSQILEALVGRRALSPEQVTDFLSVARGVGSDHNLARTLTALVEAQELEADGVEGVLSTVRGVGSDHQRLTVMLAVAARFELAGPALEAYEALASDLGRSQRDRALAALVR